MKPDFHDSPQYQALVMLAKDNPNVLAARFFLAACAIGTVAGIRYAWPDSPWLFAIACSLVFVAPAISSFGMQKRARHVFKVLGRRMQQERECTVERTGDGGVHINLSAPDGTNWRATTRELDGKIMVALDKQPVHQTIVHFDYDGTPLAIIFGGDIFLWDFSAEKLTDIKADKN